MIKCWGEESRFINRAAVPPEESRRLRMFGGDAASAAAIGDRVVLGVTTAPGNYGLYGVVVGWTAADPTAGNTFVASGKNTVLANNTSGSAQTVTVTSVADPTTGRTMTQVRSIPAGQIAFFGPFVPNVWGQSDGSIWLDATSASVLIAVVAPT